MPSKTWRAGKAKSDMPQPDGQDVHRIVDGRNRGHQKYAEPGEAFRSETETQDETAIRSPTHAHDQEIGEEGGQRRAPPFCNHIIREKP